MTEIVNDGNKIYDIFYKNHFEVIIDDLDVTRLYTNAIHFHKLSKSGIVTMYVTDEVLNWINSLHRMQSANMKYIVYSPNGSVKDIVYDGRIVIEDVVYNCKTLKDADDNREMLIDIEFSTCDKRMINS